MQRARPHVGYVAGRADPLLLAAYLHTDVFIEKLMAEVETMAATPLPVAARQPRLVALAAEVERLQRVEEALRPEGNRGCSRHDGQNHGCSSGACEWHIMRPTTAPLASPSLTS